MLSTKGRQLINGKYKLPETSGYACFNDLIRAQQKDAQPAPHPMLPLKDTPVLPPLRPGLQTPAQAPAAAPANLAPTSKP